ncbi:gamma-glutamyl phosphate reductase [Rhizobium tibeticum]|uniref:hypothetical protein n=1 Tax=Rhizobium tibeticum TaxID=501024 RepID=UPI002785CC64|nr:hypothetical protein [Rhizobium tibeticum]MDP9812214.1 gamma-glutamyl phosphate reductase [Rhizobium tibeticum]
MPAEMLSEIRQARQALSRLSPDDRRRLVSKIIEALDAARDEAADSNSSINLDGLDRVIASTAMAIVDIGVLDDIEFATLVSEFEILLVKLSESFHANARPPTRDVH